MLGRPEADVSEENPMTFTDVNEDLSYYNAIRWAYYAGLIKGYNDGTFKPDDALTRGNIVTMIWRLKEKPEGESYIVFSDVDGTDPCYRAIRWAAAVGLVKGFSDGTFGSKNNCTRAQLAIILFRGVENGLLEIFKEEVQVAEPAPETPVEEDPQQTEEGWFDEYGNYYVSDGYYDVYGNFHSYYENDDNSGDNTGEEGYYDEYGNYHVGDGYYDIYGNYHVDGGYYDEYGNFHTYDEYYGYGESEDDTSYYGDGYYDDYGNYHGYDYFGNYYP